MALINRWSLVPSLSNGDITKDIVSGLVLPNNGGVTMDESNGAKFDGSSQWLGGIPYNFPATSTISIWIKPTVLASNAHMFGVSDGTSSKCLMFGWQSGVLKAYYGENGAALSPANPAENFTNFPSNKFTLIILQYGVGGAQLCIPSLNYVATSPTSGPYVSSGSLGIARGGWAMYYAGYAKDARIYNHTLSSTEIATLYSLGANSAGGGAVTPPQCYAGGI